MKIIRISALWCMSCIVMRQRFEDLEKTFNLEFIDYDFDVDDVSTFKINRILPVHIFLDEQGRECYRLEGEVSKRKLIKILEAL